MEHQGSDVDKDIVAIGRLLWEKGLASALSGNISVRISNGLAITATQTCLGLLRSEDIIRVGEDEQEGTPSTELPLHKAIYENFKEVHSIVHVHPVRANAYFLANDRFEPQILESKYVLGDVPVVDQTTINVKDIDAVIEAFRANPLVVLRRHGVMAIGKDLFSCFMLIQSLETALQTEALYRIFKDEAD